MKKSIGKYFLNSIILLSFSLLFLSTAISMFNTYRQYLVTTKSVAETYIEEQEAIIKYNVKQMVSDIEYRCLNESTDQKSLRKKILEWLIQVRFPNQGKNPGFFFIRSMDGISIMSVSTPNLVGVDISNKKGPDGIITHDLFIKTLKDGNGEGFANYSWFNPDTGKVEKKRSYIKTISGWNSYLGAGFWLNDIQSVIDDKKDAIFHLLVKQFFIMIILMIIFAFTVFIVSLFFRKKMIRHFSHFINFFQESSNSAALIDVEKLEYSEFKEIAIYANKMSLKQTKADTEIKQALAQKELLLKELYHRTKNNMQVIISLLSLKASTIDDEALELVLQDVQNKIYSMAMVHEKLYQSKDLSNLELDDYILDLCNYLKESIADNEQHFTFSFDMEKIIILIDYALPIGLILNELISNIIKHAFSGSEPGEIKISLKRHNETISLDVKDNGKGLPAGFNYKDSNTLGLQTIFSLVESQLNGTVEFEDNNGVTCKIKFKDNSYSPRV